MNMEGWIRCNKCYEQFRDSNKTFSVTQCMHIFCEHCVPRGVGDTNCPECSAVDVQTMILERRPLEHTLLAPFCKSLPETMAEAERAAEFQRNQASIVFRRYDEIESKYNRLKEMYRKSEDERKWLEEHRSERHEQLDSYIRDAARQLRYYINKEKSKPASAANHLKDTISLGTNSQRNAPPSRNISILVDQPSNRDRGNTGVFTPLKYSSRVIISDGSSSKTPDS